MAVTAAKSQSSDFAAMDIYPLHLLDDRKATRGMIMGWIFRVNAPLDAEMVRSALCRVLEIGDWRKLAGTLHRNDAGRLEVHVLRKSIDDFQPFTYKHVDRSDEAFGDDEAGRGFPDVFENSSVVYHMRSEFREFIFERDWPNHADGYVSRGLPQLGLRITSFRDVTLLAVTWPHTALDGGSKRDLLEAWSLALAGKEQQIRPVLGAREDIAWNLAGKVSDDELELDVLEEQRLTGFGRFVFLLRVAWRMLTDRGRQARMFLLPRAVIQKWRDDGAHDIPTDPVTGKPEFVSDGDFIAAWLVKLTAVSFRKPMRYTVIGAVNARRLLSQVRGDGGVYLQNLLTLSQSPVSPEEAVSSVARIAHAIRRSLDGQLTGDQMIHHFKRHRREIEAGKGDGVINLFCRRDDVPVLCSNLSGLRLASAIDFGPAVLPDADGSRSSGAVVNHFYMKMKKGAYVRPLFVILDQDEAGYFIYCDAPPQAWAMIEKEIGAGKEQN